MKFTLDIYSGSGVEKTPDMEVAANTTREAMRQCRVMAQTLWGRAERCYPEDDGIASYGPPDGECYVTLRQGQEDIVPTVL